MLPSPFLDIHPESLSPDHPSRSPRYREAEISQGEGSNMQIDLANTLVHKVYSCLLCIVHHWPASSRSPPLGGVGGGLSPLLWRGRGRGFWGWASLPSLWRGRGIFLRFSGLPVRLIIHHDGLFFEVYCHTHRDGMVEPLARKRDIGSGAVLFE